MMWDSSCALKDSTINYFGTLKNYSPIHEHTGILPIFGISFGYLSLFLYIYLHLQVKCVLQ